jgi:glycosyltransferase involved in cell wall biosynthesis
MLFAGDITPPEALQDQGDFTGALSPAEAAKAICRMKYFVLCDRRGISFRKGSAAAALLNRVPVVATRTEWTDREFRHAENVYFFDGTEKGLCRAIEALEADPKLRERIASGGRALYDAFMAPEKSAARILDLLES